MSRPYVTCWQCEGRGEWWDGTVQQGGPVRCGICNGGGVMPPFDTCECRHCGELLTIEAHQEPLPNGMVAGFCNEKCAGNHEPPSVSSEAFRGGEAAAFNREEARRAQALKR